MIQRIRNGLSKFRWRMKRVRVFALVGKSGTGKSFRARLVMEKHGIDLVIDDGLLIQDQRILAGRSAKRENLRVSAIKRAIFEDPDHAADILKTLEETPFQSILILGISDNMILRIVERLNLPEPEQTIYIEEIATDDEITQARHSRKVEGKHVIPVPIIEVRQHPGHRIIDSIKFFLKTHPLSFRKRREIEKTIVQPPFQKPGRLMISETALSQMIMHCVQEYSPDINIKKILINNITGGHCVELKLGIQFGVNVPENLDRLQDYIVTHVERYSGVHIEKLDLTADQIETNA